MDPILYGNIINVFSSTDSKVVYVIQANNGNVYNIEVSPISHVGEVSSKYKTNNVKAYRNGILTLSYTDVQVSDNKFIWLRLL